MFSRTTIESSTTRPIAMVSAPSVSMLRERSLVHRTIRARTTESGMETAVTSVERIDARKTRMTMTAKTRPSAPSVVRPSMDLETAGPWSLATVRSEPAPRSLRRSGSLSLTASEMATALPSWSMVIATARLGLPLVRVMDVASMRLLLDRGEVAEADRLAGALPGLGLGGDHQVLDLLQGGEAAADLDGAVLAVLVEGARGERGAARLERLAQRGRGQARPGQLLVVGGDVDLEVAHAVDGDLADAVDVLHGGDDGAVELVGERLLVLVGGDGEDHGRDVIRGTGDDLRVDVVGEFGPGAVHGLLDIGDELLGAVAVVELGHDHGVALARRGGDSGDPVDRVDGGLERFDDLLFDHIGGRALVRGQDGHHRKFDGGQQLLLELRDRDGAEDERDDRYQPDQGPLGQAESGQPGHGGLSLWRTAQERAPAGRCPTGAPYTICHVQGGNRHSRVPFLCGAYCGRSTQRPGSLHPWTYQARFVGNDDELCPVTGAELRHRAVHMGLHGERADLEPLGDLVVRVPMRRPGRGPRARAR